MKRIKIHDVNRKGDLAEYYAITWLWDKGFEVFKNCGCTGTVDLIAIDKDYNIKLIDVKTFGLDTRWNGTWTNVSTPRTKEQIEMGVCLLGYNPKSRKLRFVEHKI
jgi:Holliday junction resolvase-like predicted endonuclease|tara:strand:- start:596 stop:913 length:318 start_codon:yes stop_codon:yes gene_type:complete